MYFTPTETDETLIERIIVSTLITQLQKELSQTTNPQNSSLIDLDLRVDHVFSTEKTHQIQQETRNDPVISHLMEVIVTGWPESIKDLPTDIKPYWSFRDELSVDNGLVLKGNIVVIPQHVQQQVFSEHGILDKIVSAQFQEFTKSWCMDHVTSSPRRPNCNGFIERQIRTIKSVLKKAKQLKEGLNSQQLSDGSPAV